MNFYKDPLLEKLRLIESRILGEALSDDEFVELQILRAELADDPEVSKLHSDVDAVVTARARDLEKPSVTTDPNKPPVDPNKKKRPYGNNYKNPGTRAFQNWLNAHGVKVTVDGVYGPETQTAGQAYYEKIKDYKRPNHDAEYKEFSDMQGCGTAYNVRPDKNDDKGYMWLGSKTYLAAMQKYGYDPKTGNPVGGGPAKPAGQAASPTNKLTPAEIEKRNAEIQGGKNVDAAGNTTAPAASTNPEIAKIDAEIKRFTSGGNNMTLQANKDYVANLEKKKLALSAAPSPQAAQPGIPPELSTAVPNPKDGQDYWVNGTRYTFKGFGGGRSYSKPKWTVDHSPGDFAFKASTEWATKNKFTGTPDQAQAQYMQKTFPQGYANPPAAESAEIDRLKQLLKF